MSIATTLRQHHIDFIRVSGAPVVRMGCPQCCGGEGDITLWFNIIKHNGGCFRCGTEYKTEKEFLKLFSIKSINEKIQFEETIIKKKPLMTPLPEEAMVAYKNEEATKYLQSRGLYISDIKKFAILYCPTGYYEKRVIIPIFNRMGEYRTFIARSIDPNVEKRYLFPKGGAVSSLLYNLHFVKNVSEVWLVEGPFDAIYCFPNGVATFGKHVSYRQIQLLQRHGIKSCYVCFDWDSWAVTPKLLDRTVQQLKKYFYTYVVKLPKEKTDPTNYPLQELKKLINNARITF